MTIVWLVVWFISDRIGGREALTFDPVNVWAGTLLLARWTPPRSPRRSIRGWCN